MGSPVNGGPVSNGEALGISLAVDGVDNVRAAVRRNLSNGATQIKLHLHTEMAA
jgi:hypothetical protein